MATQPRTAASCALCGASRWQDRFLLDDRLGLLPGPWPLACCQACGHLQLRERPSEAALVGAYPAGYWRKLGQGRPRGGLGAWLAQGKAAYRAWLWASDLAPFASWLRGAPAWVDLGAGAGDWVATAQALGCPAQGLERAAPAVAQAQARGLPVRQGDWAELTEGAADGLSLWHVLEHLEAPVAALQALAPKLKPGGLLLVQVPNAHSLQARWLGRRWLAWDAPRHLHHFGPESLALCLTQAGFEPLAWRQLSWRSSPTTWASSCWPALDPQRLSQLPEGAWRRQAGEVALLLATWALAPACALEALLGRGGTLTVLARRRQAGPSVVA